MVTSWLVWFERHPRPGGGARAVGAITAIFAALLVAKTEYHSAVRLEDGRLNVQIRLIGNAALQSDPWCSDISGSL